MRMTESERERERHRNFIDYKTILYSSYNVMDYKIKNQILV